MSESTLAPETQAELESVYKFESECAEDKAEMEKFDKLFEDTLRKGLAGKSEYNRNLNLDLNFTWTST